MRDVLTFGEAMIRLSPPDHQRLEQAATLEVAVGGAELSVAAGVARLGLKSAWVSATNAGDYIRAGAAAVEAREYGRLTETARQLVDVVQKARGAKWQ